jgi:hypothetical protein
MSVIKSVRAFINKCPFLDEFDAIVGVEYLPEDEKSFVIEASITDKPIVKKYLNGDKIKRFNFVFASREYFGADNVENMDIAKFYEHFSEWLEQCDEIEIFPDMEEGKTATSIQALTNGYVYDQTETKAQYQIQCQLTYFQKRL